MNATARRVAVLGGGIMGACVAMFLARRGLEVSVFEKESAPLTCASRWNEGKIHLGYLYAADRSMRTAELLIPGAVVFRNLIFELVGSDVVHHTTFQDDLCLIHRNSVIGAEVVRAQFAAVSELVRNHPDARSYLADASTAHARELSSRELAAIANTTDIVAGFEIPERSVETQWVADRLTDALLSEPRVSLRTEITISEAVPRESAGGSWRVLGQPHVDEVFDVVVNALWEGRLAIDRAAGLEPEPGWSHRYRLSVFVRTGERVGIRSAVVGVGPFGDIKNYNERDFYLSWYPTGLVAEGHSMILCRPAPLSADDERRFVREVVSSLAKLIPSSANILAAAEHVKVRGGFVFAQGQGSIGDPRSTLHRRDRFGVRRLGNYHSVDTGKYSTAPWIAANLASSICGD
jgi:glycine/D-amino acid oxidase-like deaminating enzyme